MNPALRYGLVFMERREIAQGIFTISGVLTSEECLEMIGLAGRNGFTAAPINSLGGTRVDKETRSNDRTIIDDPQIASRLWERVQEFVPPFLAGRQVRGLNERFRFYR